MPDPQAHPQTPQMRRVALNALIAGVVIMGLKFAIFAMTNSAAVLSDALESIINLLAATMMLYSVNVANRPADRDHPYGHGKVEFMVVGLEGWLILVAGIVIAYEAVRRLFYPPELPVGRFLVSAYLLGGVAVLAAILALYVYINGRRYGSATLKADGKHLFTDAASTLGGVLGLALVSYHPDKLWLDPLVAIITAFIIFFTSWKLLWQSVHGLMDRIDPEDEALIRQILDEEVAAGAIRGYHKVRHRHSGAFHWVDMHLQVEPEMTVRAGHELASRIEYRIEQSLGDANATAHLEPCDPPGPAAEAAPGDPR